MALKQKTFFFKVLIFKFVYLLYDFYDLSKKKIFKMNYYLLLLFIIYLKYFSLLMHMHGS